MPSLPQSRGMKTDVHRRSSWLASLLCFPEGRSNSLARLSGYSKVVPTRWQGFRDTRKVESTRWQGLRDNRKVVPTRWQALEICRKSIQLVGGTLSRFSKVDPTRSARAFEIRRRKAANLLGITEIRSRYVQRVGRRRRELRYSSQRRLDRPMAPRLQHEKDFVPCCQP